jgi:killing trait domain-containing protein
MAADGQTSDFTGNDPQILATAPALMLGKLYEAIGQALALAALNAGNAQQQVQTMAQAATTQGVAILYSVDTAALGLATKKEIDKK